MSDAPILSIEGLEAKVAEEDLQEQLLAHAEEAAVRARDRLGGGNVGIATQLQVVVRPHQDGILRWLRPPGAKDQRPVGMHAPFIDPGDQLLHACLEQRVGKRGGSLGLLLKA